MVNNVLVLKGWVMGIYDNLWKDKVINILNEFIIKHHIDIITWDGDLLKDDSFTQIIPELVENHPGIRLIIFKKESDKMNLLYKYIDNNEKGYSFLTKENSVFLSLNDDYNSNNSKIIVCIDDHILINDITTGDNIDYVQLGLEGYKYINSKVPTNHVFVIRMGVGNVTRKENEAITSDNNNIYPNVMFIDIPTTRKLLDKDIETFPSII